MKKRLPILLLVFVLVFALTVLFSSSAFLRNNLIRPLFIVIQVVVAVVESMPRFLLWLIFGLIGLQVMLRSMYSFILEGIWNKQKTGAPPAEPVAGPVERYTQWVKQSADGEFFAQRLSQQLASFTISSSQAPSTPKPSRQQIERLLNNNSLNFPDDVNDYLKQNLIKNGRSRLNRNSKLDTAGLDATLSYIEAQLGIDPNAADRNLEEQA